MNAVTTTPTAGEIAELVIVKGDLSKLTPQERADYYGAVCRSIGLNPLTRPLEYLTLNQKMVLYARRDAADQLRKINGISIEIVSRTLEDGLFTVHVRAKDRSGRTDEDLGVVSLGTAKGEVAANVILKAITKAKRRVTLSISGLGFLDETEVEDIPSTRRSVPSDDAPPPLAIAPAPVAAPADPETGEVGPHRVAVPERHDGNGADWIGYGRSLIAGIKASASGDEIDAWLEANEAALTNMRLDAPKARASIDAAVAKQREALAAADPPNMIAAG